jgi:hypothetical protein
MRYIVERKIQKILQAEACASTSPGHQNSTSDGPLTRPSEKTSSIALTIPWWLGPKFLGAARQLQHYLHLFNCATINKWIKTDAMKMMSRVPQDGIT